MSDVEELISGLGLTIFFWPRPHSIWPRPHSSLASLTSLFLSRKSTERQSAIHDSLERLGTILRGTVTVVVCVVVRVVVCCRRMALIRSVFCIMRARYSSSC